MMDEKLMDCCGRKSANDRIGERIQAAEILSKILGSKCDQQRKALLV